MNIETDHGLLLVVLVNLMVNATQAIHEARPPLGAISTPNGGDQIIILVESEPQDTQIVLFIANTGPAVPPELHERIFKLGIDNEATVKNLHVDTNDCVEPLKLCFARQREVLRRVNDVFLKPAPNDLPEFIRESLRGFAVRMEEDAIPLKIVSADLSD